MASPFDKVLETVGIIHRSILLRTPWHNIKVERSHRNDQKWMHFRSVEKFNEKLAKHLKWTNNKTMRALEGKRPLQLLAEKLSL